MFNKESTSDTQGSIDDGNVKKTPDTIGTYFFDKFDINGELVHPGSLLVVKNKNTIPGTRVEVHKIKAYSLKKIISSLNERRVTI